MHLLRGMSYRIGWMCRRTAWTGKLKSGMLSPVLLQQVVEGQEEVGVGVSLLEVGVA
jgi:hypothetical protein